MNIKHSNIIIIFKLNYNLNYEKVNYTFYYIRSFELNLNHTFEHFSIYILNNMLYKIVINKNLLTYKNQ